MKHGNHMIYSEHGGSKIVSLMFSKVKTKPFFSLISKYRNYKKIQILITLILTLRVV